MGSAPIRAVRFVGRRVHESGRVEIALDFDEPCRAERIVVDRFGRVADAVVDRGDFACDRSVDVRGRFNRFDRRDIVLGFDRVASSGRDFDEYDIR